MTKRTKPAPVLPDAEIDTLIAAATMAPEMEEIFRD
jgi:hypothetical protein